MQIEKLRRLRAERDEAAAQSALEALTSGARGKANLLQLSVEAARAKATVGEISLAMEKAFGRHVAEIRSRFPASISPRRGRPPKPTSA